MPRWSRVKLVAFALCIGSLSSASLSSPALGDTVARAADPTAAAPPIRIGYAISRTGPFAPGAQVTQEPNYLLWADQVNAAGGLSVKGSASKRKVELIGYDDRSDVETTVRTYEKLMGSDKVDLILPPWGSGTNFAVAPLANKHHYPMLAPTALSRKLIDMKLPYFFSLLQQPDRMMGALVDFLVANNVKTVAIIYMDDLFGLENVNALVPLLKAKKIEIAENKSYPLGVKDLSPVLKAIKAKNVDAFLGITYPPDTILASKQAREIGFAPKVFYSSVGTAFPLYKDVMGASAEDVMGMGSWNTKTSPAAKAYFDAHVKKFGKEPDRWASGHCWAGLQIMQQAIEKVGLDRKALRDYIAATEFQTIIGPIRFKGSENVSTPGTIGQWQKGEFEVVWPKDHATATAVFPKPAWK
jgi:branched-chain amino acid transport system substrate-binding protein